MRKKRRDKTTEEKLKLNIGYHPPHSPLTEAYRTLRTSLLFSFVDKKLQALMIASTGPEEGKTLTAVNLGHMLALDGKTVLIVDADLVKSSLNLYFGIDRSPGLTDVLSQIHLAGQGRSDADKKGDRLAIIRMKVKSAIVRTDPDGLFVLPSGSVAPNPTEMLGSKGMFFLVAELKKKFDFIVFDTPPVLSASDSQVLAPVADGVVFVVRSGYTNRDAARRAIERLRAARANILGVLLNQVDMKKSGDYGYLDGYYGRKK